MDNNDIFRRLRYIENFSDEVLVDLFKSVGCSILVEKVSGLLKKDDHPEFLAMQDEELANFLNALIILKRGKKEGETPKPEKELGNNLVLKKLTIAYKLRSEEVIEILKLNDFRLGKSELSAFFRKKDHKNYRECKDQVLRNFLVGLQLSKNKN